MADEIITVEWIATAQSMLTTIQKIDAKIERQEKMMQKLADTSKQGADAAAGSFNKLEQELRDGEAALKAMVIGSAEFDQQRRKVDALRNALDKANKELKEGRQSPWPQVAQGMGMATGAALALFAALSKVAQAQREIVSQGADQAVNLDTLARKMQIQAGLTDEERRAESLKVIEQSSQAGVTAEAGFQAATQLAGSGFKDPVQSGSLQTILNTMQASSFQGSPDELVSAFAEALNAYGLEKTNQNLQQIAVSAQSLFKQTDFQLTELQDFAKNASVFEGANIKIDEALAGFTALREVLPAAESGTGLRNFVNKLQAGDLTNENKQNLERIGVDAGQVDFVGESLTQVLKTVKDATDKMPEADRNAALGKMFGTENVASARLLINSVPRIQELQKSQQNADQFNTDLQTASGGMQAERNRIENQRILSIMPNAEALNQLENVQRLRDVSQQAAVENATVKFGGATGVAVQATAAALNTGDTLFGQGNTQRQAEGIFTLGGSELLRFFSTSEQRQAELIQLQRENNEILKGQAPAKKPPAPPQKQRPQVAPLPAATAP